MSRTGVQHRRLAVIGPYLLLDTIGTGASSEVRLAFNSGTRQHHACKIIQKDSVRERDQKSQVYEEIKGMNKVLNHPNVVALYGVYNTPRRIYIVMELIKGRELFDEIIRHRHLTEPYARFLFRQLVNAVSFCHSKGVYHRDLKPDNIMLTDNNVLKILDFGLAKLKKLHQAESSEVARTVLLHTQCGTPNYIAPEILTASKEGYSGSKVDAWSIGIILYVMIAGSLPFESSESENLFKLILRCNVTYPEHFSPALKDLLSKILTNNPKQRLSIDAIKEHPWLTGPVHSSMGTCSNEHEDFFTDLDNEEAALVPNILNTPLEPNETFQSLNLGQNAESFNDSRAQSILQQMIAESNLLEGDTGSQDTGSQDAGSQDAGSQDDHSENTSSSPGLAHENAEAQLQAEGNEVMTQQVSPQYYPPKVPSYELAENEYGSQHFDRTDIVVVAEVPAKMRVSRGAQVNSIGDGMQRGWNKVTLSMKHGLRTSATQTPFEAETGTREDIYRRPRPLGSQHSRSEPLVHRNARRKPRTPGIHHGDQPIRQEYFPDENNGFKRLYSGSISSRETVVHPKRSQGESSMKKYSKYSYSEQHEKRGPSPTIPTKGRPAEQRGTETSVAYDEVASHDSLVASGSTFPQWRESTSRNMSQGQWESEDSHNEQKNLLLEDSWLDTKCHPKAWGMWLTHEVEHGKSRDKLNDGWGAALAEEGLLTHPSRGTSETRVRFSEDETAEIRSSSSPKRHENSVHKNGRANRPNAKDTTDKETFIVEVSPNAEDSETPDRAARETPFTKPGGKQIVAIKETGPISETQRGFRPRPNTINALEMEIPCAQEEDLSSPKPGISAALRPGLDGAWRFLKSPRSVIGKAPSSTQFYTFEKPLKCYQTVVKALGEYSCVKFAPSTGLPVSRFRVKFEINRLEDNLAGTILVVPHDRHLAKVVMKKRLGVEEEVFTQFFNEFYGKCDKISKSLAGVGLK